MQEITADIFKLENKKGYSNLSYEKFLEYLEIDDEIFTDKDIIPMKEIDKKVIERIAENLILLTKAYGDDDQGNESKRQEFVPTVISNIVAQYYDKSPVEFVIARGKLILIVSEAKKQDWDQGTSKYHVVYGIVTTGYTWEIICCQGSDINGSKNIRSNIIWKHEEKFDQLKQA